MATLARLGGLEKAAAETLVLCPSPFTAFLALPNSHSSQGSVAVAAFVVSEVIMVLKGALKVNTTKPGKVLFFLDCNAMFVSFSFRMEA